MHFNLPKRYNATKRNHDGISQWRAPPAHTRDDGQKLPFKFCFQLHNIALVVSHLVVSHSILT